MLKLYAAGLMEALVGSREGWPASAKKLVSWSNSRQVQ